MGMNEKSLEDVTEEDVDLEEPTEEFNSISTGDSIREAIEELMEESIGITSKEEIEESSKITTVDSNFEILEERIDVSVEESNQDTRKKEMQVSTEEPNLDTRKEEMEALTERPKKETKKVPYLLNFILFPIAFIYLEAMFHLLVFEKLDGTILYPVLTAGVVGCIITLITSLFGRKVNCILAMSLVSILSLWYCIQLVFEHIFRTFLSLYSVGENGGDVIEFWREALAGILEKLVGILLLLLPIVAVAVLIRKFKLFPKKPLKTIGKVAGSAVIVHIFFLLLLLIPGKEAHTPYDLYHNDFVQDLGVEKLGILTATRVDIKNVFFGVDDFSMGEDVFVEVEQPIVVITPTNIPVTVTKVPDATLTPTPLPTQIPIDTSPNVLEIDFATLAKEAKDNATASLFEYFANVTPTNKNEYTGMFEGYNLIYLTAEGFSPWAVDKEITPTLYQLTHSGFVFENFYNPIWWTSTSDGEYVGCTGLIPSGTNSFTKSAEGDMPFCLGWQFKELGYTTRAYHNHSYTYYHRNLTHPNMGYDYKGAKGGGLDVKLTWPESDLEMIQKTLPEYIKDEQFHTYYMTVSGHMDYTFIGNSMSSKNKDYVKDLPYSEGGKAYIACNKELDLALEYLIQELDKAGILDKTVIALSADHYPYGLAQEDINELAGHEVEENFELYENYFILWNSSIKEPIIIDKYCSTVDIIPTLNNLFGIKYDSRLFMGQDILSDAPALVMTSNQSFITDYVKYNSKTGTYELMQEVDLPENYIKGYISIIKNKFSVSGSMIKNNFYGKLLPYLNLTTYEKPEIEE